MPRVVRDSKCGIHFGSAGREGAERRQSPQFSLNPVALIISDWIPSTTRTCKRLRLWQYKTVTLFPLLSALPQMCCYPRVTLLLSTSLPRGFLKFSNTFWGRNIKLSVIRTLFRPFVFWIKLSICKTEVNLPFYEGSGAEEQLSCLTPRLSLFKGLQVSRYHITPSPKVSVRSRKGHLRTSRRFLISNKRCCSLSITQSSWQKHVVSPAGHADVDIRDWNL